MTTYSATAGSPATGLALDAGDTLLVSSGGTASNTSVFGGSETVLSGGVDADSVISFGGQEIIDTGAASFGAQVVSGTQTVFGSATAAAVGVVLDGFGAVQNIDDGGVATGGTIIYDGYQNVGLIGSGTAIDTLLALGGTQNIISGTALSTTIIGSGLQFVNAGGIAIDTTISGVDSEQLVRVGGLASGTTITGEAEQILVGGSATDTTVRNGGQQWLFEGATATNTILEGAQSVGTGATAYDTIISRGGFQFVSSGGVADNNTLYGDTFQIVIGSAVNNIVGGTEQVPGTVIGATIVSGGIQYLDAGGTASNIVISAGGEAMIFSGAAAYNSEIDGGLLDVRSGVTTAGSVAFAAAGTLEVDGLQSGMFAAAVSDFATGDTIDLTALTYGMAAGATISGTTLTVTDGVHDVTFRLADSSATGAATHDDGSGGVLVIGDALDVACYRRGTRIRTEAGDIPIEQLGIGARVTTQSGVGTVRWVGRRAIDCIRHPDPQAVWPVRVEQGAFAQGVPMRDLWLSPGHNIAAEGCLMPISALLNGRTIEQVALPRVEYWHVELERHDIIFAEGLAAESYLDTGNRCAFENGGAFIVQHPDFRARHWAETCRELVFDGPAVQRVKAGLLGRAAACGHLLSAEDDLHVSADGTRIDPLRISASRAAFLLPPGSRDITLRSRHFIAAHAEPASTDIRRLGVCVMRLQIDGSEADLATLASGWHALEDGRFRWTDGAAKLPAAARLVVVELCGRGYYWEEKGRKEALLF